MIAICTCRRNGAGVGASTPILRCAEGEKKLVYHEKRSGAAGELHDVRDCTAGRTSPLAMRVLVCQRKTCSREKTQNGLSPMDMNIPFGFRKKDKYEYIAQCQNVKVASKLKIDSASRVKIADIKWHSQRRQ